MVPAARTLALILVACACVSAQRVRVKLAGSGVVTLDLEEYVSWVLAGEAGGFTQGAAVEAMAIVARTYARANLGRHAREGFDFCETTHCQDARPAGLTARLRRAQEATAGEVLWHQGRVAGVYYHKHCGGRTEAAGEVWPGEGRPYLQSVEDPFCVAAGRAEWTARRSLAELGDGLGLKKLESFETGRRTVSGRVAELVTNRGVVEASRLSWGLTPSRLYQVRVDGERVSFSGRGEGHGVGLCQRGAEERAKVGHGAAGILAAYLPGTRTGQTPQDIAWKVMRGERAEVWGTGESGEGSLVALADRAIEEAERRSGVRAGMPVRVHFYPTTAIFREATGEPGFVAASTRGRTIRLQPAGRLRSEGTLETTLLHEMLHVALEGRLGPRAPAWMIEGLVLYFEMGPSRGERLNPETEHRLVRPADEREMRTGYANARAAVSKLVQEKGVEGLMRDISTAGAAGVR